MTDIWVWFLVISVLFYVSYVVLKLVFYNKRRKMDMKKEMLKTEAAPFGEEPKGKLVSEEPAKKVSTLKKEVRNEPEVALKEPEPDKDMKKLIDFIQKNKKQGFKPTIIQNALLKQGWPKEKVDRAVKLAK